MATNPAKTIEAFHLAFLEALRTQLTSGRCILKGGVNLRYFFDSVRYSEDIDFDVSGIAGWTLEEKVDAVLTSRPLEYFLRSRDLRVVTEDIAKPKQTETTRRWKVPIAVTGQTDPVRTKIEFSNRNGEDRHALEAVPARVVEPYGLRPPSVRHYLAEPATEQKVLALAERSETQARDVFDLDLLMRKTQLRRGAIDAEARKAAAERALELPYEAFADQVLPFLDPKLAPVYDQTAWQQMQLFVAGKLLEEDK